MRAYVPQVLELWEPCRAAWKSGLACLPATGLTPAQVVLQTQFEAGLKAVDTGEAKAQALAKSGRYTNEISGSVDDMPWNRALALAEKEKLAKGDAPSSVRFTPETRCAEHATADLQLGLGDP